MSGDLIIDQNGEMALVYASKSPPDHPSISTLVGLEYNGINLFCCVIFDECQL